MALPPTRSSSDLQFRWKHHWELMGNSSPPCIKNCEERSLLAELRDSMDSPQRKSPFDFHLVTTPHFVGIAFVPNLHDNMILLQNEDAFLSLATWRGLSTTKWRLERIGVVSLLLRVKHATAFPRATSLATKWLLMFNKFQPPKHWNLKKCNSQPVYTKCRAQPHFGVVSSLRKHRLYWAQGLPLGTKIRKPCSSSIVEFTSLQARTLICT